MATKYGIWQERDLALDALAADVDREALLDAQVTTLAVHNRDVGAILGIFAEETTTNQRAIRTGAAAEMQPLDEFGRPVPVKPGGQYVNGFPLWKAGTAEGYDFWTREQMTVKDFADSFNLMLGADSSWVRRQLMAPAFYNGSGLSYTDITKGESFTVFGLANGDGVVYDKTSGAATDDHYGFQAAGIADATNPFDAIYTELNEHPQNAGRVVSFIAPAEEASTRLLAGFAPVQTQIIREVPAASAATTEPLFAPGLGLPLASTMNYIGAYGNVYIVTWQNMPSGYIWSVAVDADVKPLAYRQYQQAALRGLVNVGEPMYRFPYQQNNFVRAIGFGALNRVGATITKVSSGSYAAPTNFTFPIG